MNQNKDPHMSGISLPSKTIIFHGQRILEIFRDKDGKLSHKTSKLPFNLPINPVILIYPLIDVFFGFLFWLSRQDIVTEQTIVICTIDNSLLGIIAEQVMDLGLTAVFLYLYWHFLLKNFFCEVCPWHGLEHKLIQAAKENDIEHAENHSRIADECGCTYFLTIGITFVTYFIVAYIIFGMDIPVGLLTTAMINILIENKLFHKKNTWGLRLGIWLQEHYLTSEPPEELLIYGKKTMREFMGEDMA